MPSQPPHPPTRHLARSYAPLASSHDRPTIAFYTSSHGFGHAVRCAILCRALQQAVPGLRIVALTAAPTWIFPPGVEVEPCVVDAGVVQPSSLEVDARATLERYAAQIVGEESLLSAESARMRSIGARAIVADVPSAAFEVAARAGIPGIALANFSWDWIYEPFVEAQPEHAPLLAHVREQYARATLLLRLPFHDGLTAFPSVEDIPLIARRSTADRAETRRRLGLPLGVPLVLFSFGGHASDGPDEAALAALDEYAFVTTTADHPGTRAARTDPAGSRVPDRQAQAAAPCPSTLQTTRACMDEGAGAIDGGGSPDLPVDGHGPIRAVRRGRNLFLLPQLGDGYVDLLAACDVVITKPGYGIVADLIANRVPALYVSRGGFREEPVLVRALEVEARAVPLDRAALATLDLGAALARLRTLDRPWAERACNGAEVAARRILEIAGIASTAAPG